MMRLALGSAAVLTLMMGAQAAALAQQAWPSKPIRLIVTQSAGSTPDVLARVLVEHMGRHLGRAFVIDNRAGGDGLIGMQAAARAAPDGYTLALGTQSTLAIEPLLRKSMPYDAARDVSPIAVIVDDTGGLGWMVHSSMPFQSLTEMAAFARANPGKLTFGGNTSSAFMLGEWVRRRAGIDMVNVPYKDSRQLVQDFVSGQVAMGINNPTALQSYLKSGQVRLIAVSNPTRLEEWKDVPTVAETFPEFRMRSWVVLVGPAGLPTEIVSRLNGAAGAALSESEYKSQVKKFRWINVDGPRTPQQTTDFIREGREEWAQVIKALGMSPK